MIWEQSRRLAWIDILKGIGIILVVIGHVYSNKLIYDWLYSFHMPLFFLAAGWVYRRKEAVSDLKRRIQTIVIPYFSFGLIVLLYWQLVERRFRSSDMSFMDSFLGLISGQYDYLDFNVHLWFLPCFFITVVLFNILVNIENKIGNNSFLGKNLAYFISVFMGVIYIVISLPGLPWGIDLMFKYIVFFAAGNILAEKTIEQKIQKQKNIVLVIEIITLLALNFILVCFDLTTGIMWFMTAFIGVAAILFVSLLIGNNRILQYFGRISLTILCVHGPLYRILVKLISISLHMGTEIVRENFFLVTLAVTLTLAVCGVIYEVVVRIVPWMVGKKCY